MNDSAPDMEKHNEREAEELASAMKSALDGQSPSFRDLTLRLSDIRKSGVYHSRDLGYLVEDWRATDGVPALPDVSEHLDASLKQMTRSMPGLHNSELAALLSGTGEINDRAAVRDIRALAREVAGLSTPDAQNGLLVQEAVRGLKARIASPVAPGREASTSTEPAADARTAPGGDPAIVRTETDQHQADAQPPGPQAGQQERRSNATQASAPVDAASTPRVVPGAAQTSGMGAVAGSAMAAFMGKLGEVREHRQLREIAIAKESAFSAAQGLQSAMTDFRSTENGHKMVAEIAQAARAKNVSEATVIAGMTPGGSFADLHNAHQARLRGDSAYAGAHGAIERAVQKYDDTRQRVRGLSEAKGQDATALDGEYDGTDAKLAGEMQRIPGREPGKTIFEEAAHRLGELLAKAVARVTGALRTDRGPEQAPAPRATPSMAP